ncbi:hypothetical protein HMPREF0970_01176, partial [Schaalia odontolytica F0309]
MARGGQLPTEFFTNAGGCSGDQRCSHGGSLAPHGARSTKPGRERACVPPRLTMSSGPDQVSGSTAGEGRRDDEQDEPVGAPSTRSAGLGGRGDRHGARCVGRPVLGGRHATALRDFTALRTALGRSRGARGRGGRRNRLRGGHWCRTGRTGCSTCRSVAASGRSAGRATTGRSGGCGTGRAGRGRGTCVCRGRCGHSNRAASGSGRREGARHRCRVSNRGRSRSWVRRR